MLSLLSFLVVFIAVAAVSFVAGYGLSEELGKQKG